MYIYIAMAICFVINNLYAIRSAWYEPSTLYTEVFSLCVV